MKKFLYCFGTRPEIIKMAPLIKESQTQNINTVTFFSGQHRTIGTQLLSSFNIEPHHFFKMPDTEGDLNLTISNIISYFNEILSFENPDCVIVQGDTSTALACSICAFNKKIKVAHVEAGLRTFNNESPFPEEVNRKLISSLSSFHFAPTQDNKENLVLENIKDNIYVVGNTVIDAVKIALESKSSNHQDVFNLIDKQKSLIVATLHRRELHPEGIVNFCETVIDIVTNHNVQVVLPLHPSPKIRDFLKASLNHIQSVNLIEPLDYFSFIKLLSKSQLIITDSGGIQEEATYLKIPTIVYREHTERIEGIKAGCLKMTTSKDQILKSVKEVILKERKTSPDILNQAFGDGESSEKIIKILKHCFN